MNTEIILTESYYILRQWCEADVFLLFSGFIDYLITLYQSRRCCQCSLHVPCLMDAGF